MSLSLDSESLALAKELVQIPSYSGDEENIIRFLSKRMQELAFDEVCIDSMGNLLGQIGTGERSIWFDSHVDTVEVNDAKEWEYPPFSGEIANGYLHGRGSVDMKSSLAASIFAAVAARETGLAKNKRIYVSCTVNEEDCDGENLRHLLQEKNLKPDYMVICEPSNNIIMSGHKGKAQLSIRTHGISAHGAAPENGVNAVYLMAEIIRRIEDLNARLMKSDKMHGTLVLSRIRSISASLNAVPSECEIYLDRRTVPGESNDLIRSEMNSLIEGINASWAPGTLFRKSWTGHTIQYEPMHEAWKIDKRHPLTEACLRAYQNHFAREHGELGYWDFSTNAVTPVQLGIPCIGFGPGDYHLAHMRDERIAIRQISDARSFYTALIHAF